MMGISLLVATCCAVGGHWIAITVPTWFGFTDTITAGGMSVVAGLIFIFSLLVAPEKGLISRGLDRFRLYLMTLEEDLLSFYYRWEELDHAFDNQKQQQDVLEVVIDASSQVRRMAHRSLLKQGLLSFDAGEREYVLAEPGLSRARKLIQSHRLWEAYLVQHLAIPADHVHASAERLEHVTTDAMRQRLKDVVEESQTDPHGRTIPEVD